ncbi:MAG: hypothetical protein JWM00_137 [Candidatus Saccharibacteria bacterium]|nr:hypothetical protein [Candidatus Saccharibacteria bacterium]
MAISRTRKIIIIFVLAVLVIFAVFIYFSLRNPYGNYLDISNLDQHTSNKPSDEDRVNFIKHELFNAVSDNIDHHLDSNSIKDIVIRKGSFNQDLDKYTNVNTVSFIVDIASIKQSYRVSYQWDNDGKYGSKVELDEYGTKVNCLPIDELKYGDFDCTDKSREETGEENYDPVGLVLPHRVGSKYTIIDYTKSTSPNGGAPIITLLVDVYSSKLSPEITDAALDNYSIEIEKWLSSKKLDPKRYIVYYSY